MTEFEQNEQNPLDEHDFFIENTIEEEEGSSILKVAILVLVALGLLIGGYLLFFSEAGDNKSDTTENIEMTTDADTTVDATTNTLENAAVDANAETTEIQSDNNTETTPDAIEGKTDATDVSNTENSTSASTNNTNSVNTDTDLHYFIIRGAFSEEANAQKSVDGLKTAGYNAVIVGKNKAGLFMVAYEGFATIGEAKNKLAEVRNTQSDAWIYKK